MGHLGLGSEFEVRLPFSLTYPLRSPLHDLEFLLPGSTLGTLRQPPRTGRAIWFGSSRAQPLDVSVNQSLGLTTSKLVDVSLIGDIGKPVTALLHLDGATLQVPLVPHSVRSANFVLRAQQDDGSWVDMPSEPVKTLRGTILELPGSIVAASWAEGGLEARIRLATGEDWWLQPVASLVPGAGPTTHALFRNTSVEALGVCGTSSLDEPYGPMGLSGGSGAQRSSSSGGTQKAAGAICELATDADYEYFLDWGSVGGVQSRIESVINTMNLQYESEVGITHVLGTQLVRTSSNQPYKSKNASKLLNSVRSEWLTNQTGVQRDVMQLFTGKIIGGSTIGIAWLGAVCNDNIGYSMVQSDFNGNFASATDLSAHELGHNWSAGHCSCTSFTMNPYIVTANTFSSVFTIPTITSFRDASTCLGAPGGGGGGGTPVDVHVDSIVAGAVGVGKGAKSGTATVSIRDDLGGGASGVTVTGSFSGTFNESVSGVTGSGGSVSFTTAASAKGGVSVTFCVTSVSGGALPYDSNDDVMSCDSN